VTGVQTCALPIFVVSSGFLLVVVMLAHGVAFPDSPDGPARQRMKMAAPPRDSIIVAAECEPSGIDGGGT
jgi:hypothetical protein